MVGDDPGQVLGGTGPRAAADALEQGARAGLEGLALALAVAQDGERGAQALALELGTAERGAQGLDLALEPTRGRRQARRLALGQGLLGLRGAERGARAADLAGELVGRAARRAQARRGARLALAERRQELAQVVLAVARGGLLVQRAEHRGVLGLARRARLAERRARAARALGHGRVGRARLADARVRGGRAARERLELGLARLELAREPQRPVAFLDRARAPGGDAQRELRVALVGRAALAREARDLVRQAIDLGGQRLLLARPLGHVVLLGGARPP